ncbi:MAG: transposase [Candidatus Wallbacteria bacterium]|nr:transposase [Candidatus Wallbacteria bacterium]
MGDAINGVSTGNNRRADPCSLSAVIRWFKGLTAYEIRRSHPDLGFSWQPRFHDHVVRNDAELQRIRYYIENNSAEDKKHTI